MACNSWAWDVMMIDLRWNCFKAIWMQISNKFECFLMERISRALQTFAAHVKACLKLSLNQSRGLCFWWMMGAFSLIQGSHSYLDTLKTLNFANSSSRWGICLELYLKTVKTLKFNKTWNFVSSIFLMIPNSL